MLQSNSVSSTFQKNHNVFVLNGMFLISCKLPFYMVTWFQLYMLTIFSIQSKYTQPLIQMSFYITKYTFTNFNVFVMSDFCRNSLPVSDTKSNVRSWTKLLKGTFSFLLISQLEGWWLWQSLEQTRSWSLWPKIKHTVFLSSRLGTDSNIFNSLWERDDMSSTMNRCLGCPLLLLRPLALGEVVQPPSMQISVWQHTLRIGCLEPLAFSLLWEIHWTKGHWTNQDGWNKHLLLQKALRRIHSLGKLWTDLSSLVWLRVFSLDSRVLWFYESLWT